MSESRRTLGSGTIAGRRTAPAATSNPAAPPGKQPWWQLFLVYPTLAVTLVTALPTYMEKLEAWNKGVEQQELTAAKERNRLITKNFECMQSPIDWVSTANSTRVDGTICYKTGDILVRINWGDDNEFMDIVSNDRIRQAFEHERTAGIFISEANAQEVPRPRLTASSEQVICQRWIADGRLLQRVQATQGCFDQVLNTYRGVVESRKPSACSKQC